MYYTGYTFYIVISSLRPIVDICPATLTGLIESPRLRHILNDCRLELPFAVLLIKQFRDPCCLGSFASCPADSVARLNQLVGDMASNVAIYASYKNK